MLARARPALIGLCALLVVTRSRPAVAQAAPPITVEREPGAEDCPDTAGLVSRVATIIGHGSGADATPYRVIFSRSAQAYSAAIRSGAEGTTVRYLNAHEANCSALAHATAIALAVLFDADLGGITAQPAEKSEAPAAPPAAPAQPPSPTPVPPKSAAQAKPAVESDAPQAPPRSAAKVRIDPLVSVGPAALVGVLRPLVLAFVADAGLELERVRVSAGIVWAVPQTIELAPGSAREDLWSGSLRACYALSPGGALRFDLCSGALVGVATAEARGFTANERHRELFLAFPAELAVSVRAGLVGWQLGASALVVCPPNQFEVGGVGPTYRPPPLAGLLALRLFFEPKR